MHIVYFVLLLLAPFLLLSTYFMVSKSKSFWIIFLAHTFTFVLYMFLVIKYSNLITGHDEYGLGKIGLGLSFILLHIIIGFIHGIYVIKKKRKTH